MHTLSSTSFIKSPPGVSEYRVEGIVAVVKSIPLILQIDGVGRNSNGQGMNTSVSPAALVMFLGCR